MGAIIFGGNFIVKGQFSGGQLSSGEIIRGQSLLSNHPEGNCSGGNYLGERGVIFLGGSSTDTKFQKQSPVAVL